MGQMVYKLAKQFTSRRTVYI